jgi:hypothetical protein
MISDEKNLTALDRPVRSVKAPPGGDVKKRKMTAMKKVGVKRNQAPGKAVGPPAAGGQTEDPSCA